jgi:hypothetical protein
MVSEFIDAAQAVSDVQGAVEAARKRQPIGFIRAFIALFMGTIGIFFFVVPGLVAMWSFERWMNGRSERPVAAMAVGLVVTGAILYLILLVPLAVLDPSAASTFSTPWIIVDLAVTLVLTFQLGRYVFRTPAAA